MLEEAGMLTQSGNFDQVTGIKEIAKELKSRLRHFTTRLDELKDKIENTAKCYHLLDKVNATKASQSVRDYCWVHKWKWDFM